MRIGSEAQHGQHAARNSQGPPSHPPPCPHPHPHPRCWLQCPAVPRTCIAMPGELACTQCLPEVDEEENDEVFFSYLKKIITSLSFLYFLFKRQRETEISLMYCLLPKHLQQQAEPGTPGRSPVSGTESHRLGPSPAACQGGLVGSWEAALGLHPRHSANGVRTCPAVT